MALQTYDEYWLGYLAGHSQPKTRYLHYLGLFIGPVSGILASLLWKWWAFFPIYAVSYYMAHESHPMMEGNSNKEFAKRPVWSVVSFFRMMLLDATGGLEKELQRALASQPSA